MSFVVDADGYFRLFRRAAERAQRSIVILAWDFNSRTVLECEDGKPPVILGDFLDSLARRNRRLQVKILDWDYPMVFGIDREIPPTVGLAWRPHRRIDFRFDDTHPVAGSHHQKIVVIDDKLAFVGGLDLTSKRWDTCDHKAGDPRRTFEDTPYPPFHDVMVAADGEIVADILEVARERWRAATGEEISPVKVDSDPWPDIMPVHVENARVALSTTAPPEGDKKGVKEIEALYLDMIKAARRYIYVENQYFTSDVIGEALKASLALAQGPEITVVTRLLSHGWLEEVTMSTLRTKLVRDLRAADKHGRLRCVYPDVPGLCEGECLDVHSKVMIVDDEWCRIGSSNLSNRSMGMDTECDLTIEAQGDAKIAAAIRQFRDDLIAEHSAAPRRLLELPAPELTEAKLAMASVGDPGSPLALERIVEQVAPEVKMKKGFKVRKALYILGGVIAAAVVLALLWTRTPLADWVTRENASQMADWFAQRWWAPVLVVLAYTPASFIMFPRWIITMTAVLAFGPWHGLVYAFAGVIIAGICTFLPGRMVSRDTVRRLAGKKLKPLTHFMERKGLIAVTILRLMPIAPFPVVNLVMGAMRVKLWHFVVGTIIGMMPGMLAATILSEQLAAALEDPTRVNFWLIGAAVLVIVTVVFFGQRYMRRHGAAH
ncbi:MAG TPA: VTT domain-containing protein [Usitatibacter sp.]|nr:VTT domain-containing protein [Usitatibacter sp.]